MQSSLMDLVREKVVVLDGGMGTSIQKLGPTLDDYQGLEGCNEVLVETRADWIRSIHEAFFKAGCDAVETNTFGANGVVLGEYGIADRVLDLNRTAARLACEVAHGFSASGRPRFVLGSIGPGTRLPSLGHISFADLRHAFLGQCRGLIQGGVHALCIETCQDLLQIKVALDAAREAFTLEAVSVPLFVSVTIEGTGTMLLGTDVQSAVAALKPLGIDVLGLNCATGPSQMKRHVQHLSRTGPAHIMAMPNAGIPENVGGKVVYRLEPEEFAGWVEGFVREDRVGIVGGCCGTTPEHLEALVRRVGNLPAPQRETTPTAEVTSLFQSVSLRQVPPPLLIGERLNANGSKEFRERLLADDVDGMLSIAREQENGGAHVLDVCVAYVGRNETDDYRRLVPVLARNLRLPIAIDSTDPAAIEACLQLHGGRCIVNSINLEDGEGKLDRVVAAVRRFGAAVVALTIDETGMAMTADRKLEVAERILDRCTRVHGLAPHDVIVDMLTFTVASGDPATANAAAETLAAIRELKKRHPDVPTSLGVSNVSFGLKPAARRILNSVFLHEAVSAGLDMAIVNARGILPLHRIPAPLQDAARRLILNDLSQGDPLPAFMALFDTAAPLLKEDAAASAETLPPEKAVEQLVVNGSRKGVEPLLDALMASGRAPVDIINSVLIPAMKTVGDLFGTGQMQLPFVLQSAEVMKAAVGYLERFMDKADRTDRGVLVLATVRGDVHDIGKNLVDIIVSNNGFKVVNLGIKVPLEDMLKAAAEHRATAIGMSGLLVKSTVVMKENLEEMLRRGVRLPVLLGGAALSRKYVDQDLKTLYGPDVHYCNDAFEGLDALTRIVEGPALPAPMLGLPSTVEQKGACCIVTPAGQPPADSSDDETSPEAGGADRVCPPYVGSTVLADVPLPELFPLLDETSLFRGRWGFKKNRLTQEQYDALIDGKARPALSSITSRVLEQKLASVSAVYGYFRCESRGDDLVIQRHDRTGSVTLSFPRKAGKPNLCIADWFRPADKGGDVVGLFVVTAGPDIVRHVNTLFSDDRYQDYLLLQGFATELAEAGAEWLHRRMKAEMSCAGAPVGGLRFSFGYPATPDLPAQASLFQLLDPSRIGVSLTDTFQMVPEYTVSAIVVPHPRARYFSLK